MPRTKGSKNRPKTNTAKDYASQIAEKKEHLVFLLWGSYAQRKGAFIDTQRHLVLKSVHPSPLSANRGGWFGQHQFSRCNAYLVEHGMEPISW
mgnify:FL=1